MNIYFDYQQMAQELTLVLIRETDECLKQFMQEAKMGLSAKGKQATDIDEATVNAAEHIVATGKFYADAIIDSFGRGSLADDTYWLEYMGSPYWNPARFGKTIQGRPEGEYTDMWGVDRYSSGSMDGVNIEHFLKPLAGTKSIQAEEAKSGFKAHGGSRSIQSAEAWIAGKNDTWIEARLKKRATAWIAANGNKFFHN